MKQRVLTALLLIPIVVACVSWTNPIGIGLLSALALYLCNQELFALSGHQKSIAKLFAFAAFLPSAFVLIRLHSLEAYADSSELRNSILILSIASFCIGIVQVLRLNPKRNSLSTVSIATLWFVSPLILFLYLGTWGAYGKTGDFYFQDNYLLLILLTIWAGDSIAIFAGKLFGKHLLAPNISPKKTVEGGIANLLACVGVAIGMAGLLKIPMTAALGCGLSAGVLGQAGDLFQSALKRRFDVKDSGTLLPGHGGILDRIDSLLFTLPACALILYFFAR